MKSILVQQFKDARDFLIHTMHGITPVVNNRPEGFPVTIGARVAHIGSLADMMVIGAIGGKTPLSQGDWKDKTGYTIPHPGADISEWAPKVEMEIHAMHQYILAVMDEVENVLNDLSEEDFSKKEFALGPMGNMTAAQFLIKASALMYITAGEISTLRIINGLDNGYPKS